ncbi:nuclear transport factor 2 family protein [Rhodococcoides yunnanense]|uniref:nuclear transport factor 2 family protein n=1 Tax=Rhodococcoides yunnanense TaxID=278209 RepID=UPI0009340E66|nr:nuclear transport factor 2 family protein [Rhodococcus yunnanensis]
MIDIEQRLGRLEDIEQIRNLTARYCRHLDDRNWDALMEQFTPDGEFDGLSHLVGRTEMRAFFSSLVSQGFSAVWHFTDNVEIEVDGDSAVVRSYLWQPFVSDGVSSIAAGRYTDHVTKVDGTWLYRIKQVRFNFWVPLADGWDENVFSNESARSAAVDPSRK